MYTNIKLGADPELFLQNGDGKFISAIDLIGGSKESPLPIDGEGNAIQEDNVSVEFNIPPCTTKDSFIHNINKTLSHIEGLMQAKGLSLSIIPAASFDWDQLQDPRAMHFGCEPDFNAWSGEKNPKPHSDDLTLRSCGGHIHVGFDNVTQQKQMNLIRAMDIFLGVPSINFDDGDMRRELYGKPGAFRPKSYGVEYRTLSNFWIKSKELQEWAYDQTMKAVAFLNGGGVIPFTEHPKIHDAIMKKDKYSYMHLKEVYNF